jgi:DNA-binding HxlR family transcriptional regulator
VATARTYGEGCAAAHALDLVGERWALLVVRELLLGPKRFTDLRAGIVHASANVLAERLRELERAGVIRRRKLAPPAGSRVYELTDWGHELEPVLNHLGRWGSRSPALPHDAPMSFDSKVLALTALFDPDAAGDFATRLQLRLGEHELRVEVRDGRIELRRGVYDEPDAVVTTDPDTLTALAFGARRLRDAERAGAVAIDGDRRAVARFLGLFSVPEPVGGVSPAVAVASP